MYETMKILIPTIEIVLNAAIIIILLRRRKK